MSDPAPDWRAGIFSCRNVMVALFAAFAVVPFVANPYLLFVANLMLIYAILATGLNILVGFAGQFALANAAMFGIGAYGTGLLQVKLGLPYLVAAPGGILLATFIGSVITLPALRLSGIYLALSSLSFAMFTQWVLLHWKSVTFGGGGFPVPNLDLRPWLPVGPDRTIYALSWIVTALMLALAWRLVRSRIGRAFVAVRDGEIAAQALGINLLTWKTFAFALSGFYAGTAGALYGPLLGYISPEGFDLFQMIVQKAMIVVGGMGSVPGSLIGAIVITGLLEVLREFKSTQEIVFGGLLIAFVILRPRGIAAWLQALPGWREPLNAITAPHRPVASPLQLAEEGSE